MNILFVATEYPERGQPATGFPNYLYRVSLSLIRMGHKPVILAVGRTDGHRVEQGIEIWKVRVGYTDCKLQALTYMVNALRKGYVLNRKVREITEKMRIDVIQFTSLSGIAIFYRCAVPAVLRLSSYAKTAFPTSHTCSVMTVTMMSLLERMSACRCHLVFAPSEKNARIFGEDCGRKVGVIESPFVNDVQEYDCRYAQKLEGKKYVLFFGALYAEKGILVIAKILERFLGDNPGWLFVFIGDSHKIKGETYGNVLKKKAGKYADRVVIWKALPHRQLYPVIRQADFVVLPSLMENLSNACIEAMYFERVVIGTAGASFEQLIEDGKSGLLCRIGDPEDLFKKMQTAVSLSTEQKIRMGKKAKERTDKLKPEYTVKKLLHLYERVITNNRYR